MLIFEILLYILAAAMLLFYPVKALLKGGAYTYAKQPDGTDKVFKLEE